MLTNVISDFKKFEDFKFDFEKIKNDFDELYTLARLSKKEYEVLVHWYKLEELIEKYTDNIYDLDADFSIYVYVELTGEDENNYEIYF